MKAIVFVLIALVAQLSFANVTFSPDGRVATVEDLDNTYTYLNFTYYENDLYLERVHIIPKNAESTAVVQQIDNQEITVKLRVDTGTVYTGKGMIFVEALEGDFYRIGIVFVPSANAKNEIRRGNVLRVHLVETDTFNAYSLEGSSNAIDVVKAASRYNADSQHRKYFL